MKKKDGDLFPADLLREPPSVGFADCADFLQSIVKKSAKLIAEVYTVHLQNLLETFLPNRFLSQAFSSKISVSITHFLTLIFLYVLLRSGRKLLGKGDAAGRMRFSKDQVFILPGRGQFREQV